MSKINSNKRKTNINTNKKSNTKGKRKRKSKTRKIRNSSLNIYVKNICYNGVYLDTFNLDYLDLYTNYLVFL